MVPEPATLRVLYAFLSLGALLCAVFGFATGREIWRGADSLVERTLAIVELYVSLALLGVCVVTAIGAVTGIFIWK